MERESPVDAGSSTARDLVAHAALVVVRDVDDRRAGARYDIGDPTGLEVIDDDHVPGPFLEQPRERVGKRRGGDRHARQHRPQAGGPRDTVGANRVPTRRGRGHGRAGRHETETEDVDAGRRECLRQPGGVDELAVRRRVGNVAGDPEALHARDDRSPQPAGVATRRPRRANTIIAISCNPS